MTGDEGTDVLRRLHHTDSCGRFDSREDSIDSRSDDDGDVSDMFEDQPAQHCRLILYRDGVGGSFDGVNTLPLQRSREVLLLGITDRSDVTSWLEEFADSILHASCLIYDSSPELADNTNTTCIGSVLIYFQSQSAADKFYNRYHNRHFGGSGSRHTAGPVCYVVFLSELRVSTSKGIEEFRANASVRQGRGTPLPSCPYCLERLDVTVTGIITGKHGWLEMPSGSNRANWCACCEKMLMPAATMKCEQCEAMHTREAPMWVCLVCGHVGCGRYTKAACAKHHALETGHSLCVEVSSGRIWDYERDAFVHRRLVQESGKMLDLEPAAESSSPESSADGHGVRRVGINAEPSSTARSELDILLSSQIEEERRRYEEACAELEAVGESRTTHERYLMEMVDMPELERTEGLLKSRREEVSALRHELKRLRRLRTKREKELNDIKKDLATLRSEKMSLDKQVANTPLVGIEIEDDKEVQRLRKEIRLSP